MALQRWLLVLKSGATKIAGKKSDETTYITAGGKRVKEEDVAYKQLKGNGGPKDCDGV